MKAVLNPVEKRGATLASLRLGIMAGERFAIMRSERKLLLLKNKIKIADSVFVAQHFDE